MNLKHRVQGRIVDGNGAGLGTPTQEMVNKRAREIALINGRDKNPSENDLEEARRELTGVTNENREIELDAREPINATHPYDDIAGSSGERADRIEAQDEQTYAQQLVEEGAGEAEHDRMVQGARHPGNQE